MTTKRTILGTSLGQFVLQKPTTLKALLKKASESEILTIWTVTDWGDLSKTSLNLNEVKIFGYYEIEKEEAKEEA